MSAPTPDAALTEEEVEFHVCCVKPRLCRDEHFHQRAVERILAARMAALTERLAEVEDLFRTQGEGHVGLLRSRDAAEAREAALIAKVEALADAWATEGPSLVQHAHGPRDVQEGLTLERCATDLTNLLAEHATPSDPPQGEAERDDLRAVVERVRDVADMLARRAEVFNDHLTGGNEIGDTYAIAERHLRAALAGTGAQDEAGEDRG